MLFFIYFPRYLSLAETDKGVRDVLGLYHIFDCKAVIMRAFNASKSASKPIGMSLCMVSMFIDYVKINVDVAEYLSSFLTKYTTTCMF